MTPGAAAPYNHRMKALAAALAVLVLAGCGGVSVHRYVLPVAPATREIRAARRTDPTLLSIFPGYVGTIRCRIPNGAGLVSHPLHGACTTRVRRPAPHEVDVVFRETWGRHTSAWTIVEQLPGPKVQATRLSGETAPQMRYAMTDGVTPKRLLAGEVQLAAYPGGKVYVCGLQNSDLMFNQPPPDCRGDLPAVGVRVAALTGRAEGSAERWGTLYLVGSYRGGTFWVTSQRKWAPRTAGQPFLATPPCAAPSGGWRLATPTQAQRATIDHYSELAHHHDLTSVAFFDGGAVLTATSTAPQRTRAVLGRYWPRQLCVVRARYPQSLIDRVRKRMVKLLSMRSLAAEYGWINGAGGLGENDRGQPTTPLDVLIVTPTLRRLMRSEPPGLVVADPILQPVG